MNKSIYDSSNEDGLLKFIGPFKATSADLSIYGVRFPQKINVVSPVKVGKVIIYGSSVLKEKITKATEGNESKPNRKR